MTERRTGSAGAALARMEADVRALEARDHALEIALTEVRGELREIRGTLGRLERLVEDDRVSRASLAWGTWLKVAASLIGLAALGLSLASFVRGCG